MADLDTRNKRASAIGIDFSWVHVYPDPDGAFNVNDRQQTAYKYSGSFSSATGGGTVSYYRTLMGVGI